MLVVPPYLRGFDDGAVKAEEAEAATRENPEGDEQRREDMVEGEEGEGGRMHFSSRQVLRSKFCSAAAAPHRLSRRVKETD